MRIFEFAKKKQMGVSEVTAILEELKYLNISSNTKLDEKTINIILDIKSGKKTVKDFSDTIEVNLMKGLPTEFNKENRNNDFIKLFLGNTHKESQFNRHLRKIDSIEIETLFTDFEAFAVCLGLSNRRAKQIARNYFDTNNYENLIEAHQYAMETASKYGESLIKHLIKLPELPFKALEVDRVFHEFDKQVKSGFLPSFRIAFHNIEGNKEKLIISFYKNEKDTEGQFNNDLIRVYNKNNNQTQFTISRNGFILPNPKCKSIMPAIEIFTSFSNDPLKMMIHYGLETGECSVCGRPLVDTLSITRGIGPVCYEKFR